MSGGDGTREEVFLGGGRCALKRRCNLSCATDTVRGERWRPGPALIGAEAAPEPRRQTEASIQGVAGPSTLRVFTEEEGADVHCQGRNPDFSARCGLTGGRSGFANGEAGARLKPGTGSIGFHITHLLNMPTDLLVLFR